MFTLVRNLITHGIALAAGFALGIYMLPILIAPEAPSDAEVAALSSNARYSGQFIRDLPGSDLLHWGEGTVSLTGEQISFMGYMAPGPDYKLYLTPELVQTEAEFEQVKADSAKVGDIKTFENFVLSLPDGVRLEDYTAVLVWCETFGEFITAARYR